MIAAPKRQERHAGHQDSGRFVEPELRPEGETSGDFRQRCAQIDKENLQTALRRGKLPETPMGHSRSCRNLAEDLDQRPLDQALALIVARCQNDGAGGEAACCTIYDDLQVA